MRKWFASLGVLGLAATAATAQTIPSLVANGLFQATEDDGGAELAYKLGFPANTGEMFNVDFNTDASGMTCLGIAVKLFVSFGSSNIGLVAICGDNLALDASGRTPDVASPLSSLTNPTGGPSAGGTFCGGFTTYDTPDVTLGTGGVHAVLAFSNNDSATYVCTDAWDSLGFNHTGARHSFFTTDSYATPASYSFSKWNYMIRLAGAPPTPGGGLFLVNGALAGSMNGGDTVALQFWSSDTAAPTLYLEVLNVGPLIPLPGFVLSTGFTNFAANGIQQLGMLTGPMTCSAIGLTLNFGCFFSDNLDKKKNGKNKIKLSNFASTTVNTSKICTPNVCFGIRDDGTFNGGLYCPRIWYFGGVGAAGTNDCASVHMGKISPNAPIVSNLTSVESLTWDFCGTNTCWQQVGIYQSNTVLDPSGNTPDLASPLTSIGGSTACNPGGYGGVWGFPGAVYDTPDIVANTTTDYHTSFEWLSNDSCLFVGLDRDGFSDNAGNDCAGPISGTSSLNSNSYFTLDGFTTPAIDGTDPLNLSGGTGPAPYPVFNLQERINWN